MNRPTFPPKSERQALIYLQNVWSQINLLVFEKGIQGRFFAAIYYPDFNKKKKTKVFIGKLLRRYLTDEGGATLSVDLDCLELAIGSPTVLSERPAHLGKDVGTFDAFDIISWPLKVDFAGGNKWNVPAYSDIVKTFNVVAKLEREELYRQFHIM